MTEKLRGDRHIIRYAKNWYKKSTVLIDLWILVSDAIGAEMQNVNEYDVLRYVTKVVKTFFKKETDLYEMALNLIGITTNEERPLNIEDILRFYLTILSGVVDEEVLSRLGEPDYTLLPKPEGMD